MPVSRASYWCAASTSYNIAGLPGRFHKRINRIRTNIASNIRLDASHGSKAHHGIFGFPSPLLVCCNNLLPRLALLGIPALFQRGPI